MFNQDQTVKEMKNEIDFIIMHKLTTIYLLADADGDDVLHEALEEFVLTQKPESVAKLHEAGYTFKLEHAKPEFTELGIITMVAINIARTKVLLYKGEELLYKI